MTERANIYQQDLDRVFKSLARSGIERLRVVLDLENRKIEVIIGESAELAASDDDTWTDED